MKQKSNPFSMMWCSLRVSNRPSRTEKTVSCTLFIILLLTSGLSSAASPRTNYLLYCSGCHGVTGEGAPPNVPTLVGELGRMISVPQMRDYLVRIPGASQAPIDDGELTKVINWVLQEFNEDTLPTNFKQLTVNEVSAARAQVLADPLRFRTENWKPYDHQLQE